MKSVHVPYAFCTRKTYKAQDLHEAKVTLQHWFLAQPNEIPLISSVAIIFSVLDSGSDCFGLRSVAKLHAENGVYQK